MSIVFYYTEYDRSYSTGRLNKAIINLIKEKINNTLSLHLNNLWENFQIPHPNQNVEDLEVFKQIIVYLTFLLWLWVIIIPNHYLYHLNTFKTAEFSGTHSFTLMLVLVLSHESEIQKTRQKVFF